MSDVSESILNSIKKLLGPSADDDSFDVDIIMHINTAFSILNQLGAGPSDGFSIKDGTSVWTDFIGPSKKLEMVKTYIYEKVRLVFDPPQTAALIKALNDDITELGWRINAEVDPPNTV